MLWFPGLSFLWSFRDLFAWSWTFLPWAPHHCHVSHSWFSPLLLLLTVRLDIQDFSSLNSWHLVQCPELGDSPQQLLSEWMISEPCSFLLTNWNWVSFQVPLPPRLSSLLTGLRERMLSAYITIGWDTTGMEFKECWGGWHVPHQAATLSAEVVWMGLKFIQRGPLGNPSSLGKSLFPLVSGGPMCSRRHW